MSQAYLSGRLLQTLLGHRLCVELITTYDQCVSAASVCWTNTPTEVRPWSVLCTENR